MTPEQALSIIDQATQPGTKLSRGDYVLVEQAIDVLRKAVAPPIGPPAP